MVEGGDPDLSMTEDDLLVHAGDELREATARVEQRMREDYERFVAGTDEEPDHANGPLWVPLVVALIMILSTTVVVVIAGILWALTFGGGCALGWCPFT